MSLKDIRTSKRNICAVGGAQAIRFETSKVTENGTVMAKTVQAPPAKKDSPGFNLNLMDLGYLQGREVRMNNILIQFQGFHPSDFTRAFWNAQLSQLSAVAPQGATIRAGLMRKGRLFSANVRILSSSGHFYASAAGSQMRDVSHRLEMRLRKQLKRWKDLRTSRGDQRRSLNADG
jgi:hypothetical protein